MIQISYSRASFTKDFNSMLGRALNPVRMLMAAGRELANQLKNHFRRKDREEPNQLSSRREHFWRQMDRATQNPEQTGYNQVSVTVSDPRIAQKVFGGTIFAKRAGALTIPVSEQAYGRTASTFERETGLKLFLLRTGKGSFANAVLAAKVNGGLEIEYVLTKSVTQQADPTALPERSALEKAILARAQKVLENEKESA